jgi:hypothetical protein
MKLNIEEDRETIKRYKHIRPAPWGSVTCSARCPGTLRTCTLKRGHSGPHVAHGTLKKVVAVWDKDAKSEGEAKGAVSALTRTPGRSRGFFGALITLRNRVIPKPHAVEAGLFLIFALAMVGFAIDWALRILGLR